MGGDVDDRGRRCHWKEGASVPHLSGLPQHSARKPRESLTATLVPLDWDVLLEGIECVSFTSAFPVLSARFKSCFLN